MDAPTDSGSNWVRCLVPVDPDDGGPFRVEAGTRVPLSLAGIEECEEGPGQQQQPAYPAASCSESAPIIMMIIIKI